MQRASAKNHKAQPAKVPNLLHPVAMDDLRFRSLLGSAAWGRLPAAVQARFAKRLSGDKSAAYAGRIMECRMSGAGMAIAQLCRLIGAPLPLHRDCGTAALVTVTEDQDGGGQVWTRIYARAKGFPQVIHSAKRFSGSTGLEEYLGGGIGIALSVSAQGDGIRFESDHYFVRVGPMRLRLPRLIAPGKLVIDHQDLGDGAFAFTLSLRHRYLGELIHQVGHFHDQCDAQSRGIFA
jgi:hypothetical protein